MTKLVTSCSQCRREGRKLFLKGERCNGVKCAFARRSYAPGMHGKSPKKPSAYSEQLREKQKIKRSYGLRETQFRNYYEKASTSKQETGLFILQLLETRLDNVVYRLGFAPSGSLARQIVGHKHILVNGKVVNIPSYQVKPGDEISISEKSSKNAYFSSAKDILKNVKEPEWLKLNAKEFSGKVERLPKREEIDADFKENIVVEFYSR